jgi:hypothetical protein
VSSEQPLQKLNDVLRRAWQSPFSVKSDFARANAGLVALAASQGLLTTRLDRENYGTRWLITPVGIARVYKFAPAT